MVSAWLQRTVGICFVQDQHLVQENFFSKVRKDNYGDKSKCAKRFIQGKREGGVQSHQEAADLLHACRNDWSAHLSFFKLLKKLSDRDIEDVYWVIKRKVEGLL